MTIVSFRMHLGKISKNWIFDLVLTCPIIFWVTWSSIPMFYTCKKTSSSILSAHQIWAWYLKPCQKKWGVKITVDFQSPCSSGDVICVCPPIIARINHSCRPNCHHYHSGRTGEFVVRAVRDVSEGEELTISYMSPLQGWAKKMVPRLRECCRHVEAEATSNSRNKIHQTWRPQFSPSLYKIHSKAGL